MRRGVIAVGIAASVVVACTVFTEGEGEEPAPVDAGPDVDASALADRSETVDAPGVDAAVDPTKDAAADATDGSPCGTVHWLCDDFDRDGGIAPPIWGSTGVMGAGASLAIATLGMPTPPSPPNTMLVKAATNELAAAYQAGQIMGGGLHCELDVLVEKIGASEAIFFALSLNAPSAYYRVELHGPGSVTQYGNADGGALPGTSNSVTVPTGVWSHASAEIAFGANAKLTFVFNGTPVVVAPAADLTKLAAANLASVQVGAAVYNLAAGTDWQVRYDNVFCDLVPP